jgi:hypothetical protein
MRSPYQQEPMNVQEKAYELLTTYNNRQDFINIMKHIDREILGGDLLSDEEIEVDDNTINTQIINPNLNHIKYYQRSNTANLPVYEHSKTPTRIRNESPGFPLKKIHKKYTDVHANSKYYYPEGYNDDDLEPSQWNDRSNRNNYYNKNIVQQQDDEDLYYKDINNFNPKKGLYN